MEHFRPSGETISSLSHEVLNGISNRETTCLAHDIVRPRDLNFKDISSQIANDE